MAKILVAYVRKSIIDDDSTTPSPDRQRSNIDRWAAAHDYQVEHYQDLDISGRYESNRPGWQTLLQRLDDPDVAGVICESLDRIYRNRTEFGQFKAKLERLDKKLIFTNMPNVDGSTAQGNLFLGVIAEVAEFESRVASEKMKATIQYVKNINGRHWGKVPFACDRQPETFHLIPSTRFYYYNPATSQAQAADLGQPPTPPSGFEVRYYHDSLMALYQLYAAGELGLRETSEALNAAGWRIWATDCNTPAEWTFQHVWIVRNRADIYAGRLNGKPAGHEPILPVELCDAVAGARRARSGIRYPSHNLGKRPHTYLLSGILVCGRCGSRMAGQASDGKFFYRHMYTKADCNEVMANATDLEGQLIDLLLPLIKSGLLDMIRAELVLILQQAATTGDNDDTPARLLAKETELERLIDLYLKGRLTFEQFDHREKTLKAEIAGLKQQTVVGSGILADVDEWADQLMVHIKQLPDANREQQRIIIQSVIKRIRVTNKKISSISPAPWAKSLFEFCFNFLPDKTMIKNRQQVEILDLLEL